MSGPDEAPGEGEWFRGAEIQARILDYMRYEGLTILSPGQATAAEQGADIVAERLLDGRPVHRLVTVRGWPGSRHTHGTLAGQPRSTRPEVIARGWVAQAVLDLALGRGADPDVELCLALPAMASYIRYLQRLRWFMAAARVTVYLVSQEGRVTVTPPGAHPVSSPAMPEPATAGKRRRLGLPGASRLHLPLLHALVQAGGSAGRGETIAAVARWFPEVPQPPPPEFGQRVSVAKRELQLEGCTELGGRGRWRITPAGRAIYEARWEGWVEKRAR